ncbi:MAG: 2-C-methyl-D-erythritol 4-phosphate cytidylyltransferase [Herbinix sp.]|nr:2-C-methyl-D-erythritol 4-phosphate cytidylyltransferase [Herbinix sp.]
MNKITAIILAAGQGKRMNSQVAKQFLILQEKPVLYYSLKAFEESSVNDIILVTGDGQVDYCRENIIETYHFKKVTKIIEGGKERYDSVYRALLKVEPTDYVLIHDGARPFIMKDQIETVIKHVIEDKACIVGTPVKETIKIVNSEGTITSTPNRNILWSAQTPQAFEYKLIKEAYDVFNAEIDKSRIGITDDAMVYENYLKRPVKMLLGDYNNIKLTTPEDLLLAEEILKRILYEKNIKKEQFFQD